MKSLQKPKRLTASEREARRRDRSGWRSAKKRSRWGGLTKAGEQAKAKRHENAVKASVRRAVWARSGGVCECCGDTEVQTAQQHWKRTHEMHEVYKRSASRGRPAEERFNTRVCMRACRKCHVALEAHTWWVVMDDERRGMDGDYYIWDENFSERIREVRRVG